MKKAISPLISIVLLVGLTVALIATITTWSFDLTKEQKRVAEKAQQKLDLSDINIKISDIGRGGSTPQGTPITFKLSNDNENTFAGLLIRAETKNGNVLEIKEITQPLLPFKVITISTIVPENTEILKLILLAGEDGSIAIPYPTKIKMPT